MSYENIRHPDAHREHERLAYLKLETERDFYQKAYESACDDLRTIYDRVDAGEPVYFALSNGRKLYLKALKSSAE